MGMAAAETVEANSHAVAAGAAAGITQLAQTAPEMMQGFVEDTLKPAAVDIAKKLPEVVEQVGVKLLHEEGQ